MKESLLTILRDRNTPPFEFRHAANALAELIAADIATLVTKEKISIHTPVGPALGYKVKQKTVLVPILRAGMALLQPFLRLFHDAKVGFFGIKRDELTAKPHCYYENLPTFDGDEKIFLLDPMIATAGSALFAIERLIHHKVPPKSIHLVGVISAPEGIKAIQSHYPEIQITVAAHDERLNEHKFIVPGLGDFGDRYFGTS